MRYIIKYFITQNKTNKYYKWIKWDYLNIHDWSELLFIGRFPKMLSNNNQPIQDAIE